MFQYKIGDKHNRLTISSEPYVENGKRRIKLVCECGYEFSRSTHRFDKAFECKKCKAKRCFLDSNKSRSENVSQIPIGSKYEKLTVTGECFRYKSKRKLPVECDCGLKCEIYKSDWGKVKSCVKCRECVKHSTDISFNTMTKICTRCKKRKSFNDFGCDNKTRTKRRGECKECQSFNQRCQKFNISPEELNSLFESQNGRCSICNKDFNSMSDWSIDHDHHSGKIRGLLCGQCNSGLGYFYDNIEFLKRAILYLESN